MSRTLKGPGSKLTMKLFAAWAVAGLIVSLAGSTLAHDKNKTEKTGEKIERSLSVGPEATITLCVASGTLSVHGWDKNEIRVRSADAAQDEVKRIDKVKDTTKPPARIDVMVLDKTTVLKTRLDCQALASVDMDVPSGATVQGQTRDGDIMIAGGAPAYPGSQKGGLTIERATKLVEAGSVGGSIALRNSSGRVNLSSAGGGIEVINVRSATDDDTFEVGTVSGDIQLEHVGIPKVLAKTVNGTVTMSGPLAKAGNYVFNNVTGDVVLELPHDASFQLNAKVAEKHNIVSDFPLKYLNEPPPPPAKPKSSPEVPPVPAYVLRRVTAICGSGDASITVASFGGTVRLKKI